MGGHHHAQERRSRSLIIQSMFLAAGLAALKIAAGLMANSVALLASALDSLMDLFTSGLNFVSLKFSQEPADADHPYGHGKIEAVAGSMQGFVIGVGGLALLVESIRRVVNAEPVAAGPFGISVMLVSMVLSVLHARRLNRQAAGTESPIMKAEGLHFAVDVLANLGVLLALVVIRFGGTPMWDIVISILVAGYVVKEAGSLLNVSVHQLLDRRLDDRVHREIERIIVEHHPNIKGFHDFRSRRAGTKIFIDFHVEIAGVERFEEAHDITESLTAGIKKRYPNADVTIHSDPEGQC